MVQISSYSTILCATLSIIFVLSTITSAITWADSQTFGQQKDPAQSVAFNQNNTTAYVVNLHDNTLSIISGNTKTVIGSPSIASGYAAAFAIGPSSNRNLYVFNVRDNTLSIISGNTKTVIGNPLFVINGALESTIGFAKSYAPVGHNAFLSGVTLTKSSTKIGVTTAPAGSTSTHAATNSSSKTIPTAVHPPFVP